MILHFVKISGLPRFSKTYHGQCPSKTIIYTNLFRGSTKKYQKKIGVRWAQIVVLFSVRYKKLFPELPLQCITVYFGDNRGQLPPGLGPATEPLTQATGPPRSCGGVAIGMLRGNPVLSAI